MADFPATPAPAYQSIEAWRDPITTSYSRSGVLHAQRLQPAKKRTIRLEFRTLSDAERATIEAHYDANRTGTFNFTWPDGVSTYLVAYIGNSIDWKKISPGRWDATILLDMV